MWLALYFHWTHHLQSFVWKGGSICATFLANPHNLITTHFIKEKSVLTSIMLVDQISDTHQI